MPKTRPLSARDRACRELLAAIRAGQARLGESSARDVARLLRGMCCETAVYNRLREPARFRLPELLALCSHYQWDARQLCQIFGVPFEEPPGPGGRTVYVCCQAPASCPDGAPVWAGPALPWDGP